MRLRGWHVHHRGRLCILSSWLLRNWGRIDGVHCLWDWPILHSERGRHQFHLPALCSRDLFDWHEHAKHRILHALCGRNLLHWDGWHLQFCLPPLQPWKVLRIYRGSILPHLSELCSWDLFFWIRVPVHSSVCFL